MWKEEAFDDLSSKGLERHIVNKTKIGPVSKATFLTRLRRGWMGGGGGGGGGVSAYGIFRAHRYHLALNCINCDDRSM